MLTGAEAMVMIVLKRIRVSRWVRIHFLEVKSKAPIETRILPSGVINDIAS
jgi:hypothetical protein